MNEMMIVFLGIGLFIIAGLFGGLGIFSLFKNKKRLGVIYLVAGFLLIIIYMITLFLQT
ncbi:MULTISPECIES: hypothetical protein [Bacillaceae]|uniref:Exosortase n=1 Tax=Evansella alkalicola TaxID=745819 RepID=A0ABS6JTT2_9BACI|nr:MULTISPECIES: hypothetical protein [Bacillaceae]MBU9721486.1 hypothetical protein [Bacillus alkalicola]